MHLDSARLNYQALHALNEAALAITGDLSLEKTLQQIVDVTRELVSAEYAALGIPNVEYQLEAFIYSGVEAAVAKKMGQLPQGKGVLGAIIREKRPFRLRHIAEHPKSVGFPPYHPQMESFLGVPIVAGDTVYGNLYLTNKMNADEFSAEDEAMVQMLAAHAAIAIQNARLYAEVERLAVLEERNRIGMDLHDGVIQSIYAVGLTLESARLSLPEELQETGGLLETAVSQLNRSIQDIRNFIMDLRPRRFRGNLKEGIAQLVREFQANTMIPVETSIDEQLEVNQLLSKAAGQTLFLSTQEALANIARHAQATQVNVKLLLEIEWVNLIIEDNGRGFDTKQKSQKLGHGLSNMETRAQEQGGRFQLSSEPGFGTKISISLPSSK
ncbi:MAG: GAF domain-containing sensor histidine kinase [Chloroflexota bacterium]